MCLADDNKINIYYQDTDSMHITKSQVEKLGQLFTEKYGRQLIGKGLGQFHSDFGSLKNKKDPKYDNPLYASWAIKSVFLGKKSYMDVLTNIDGDLGYHI